MQALSLRLAACAALVFLLLPCPAGATPGGTPSPAATPDEPTPTIVASPEVPTEDARPPPPHDHPRQFERGAPAVVRVKQHMGGGTGFLLGSTDQVATAWHVVKDAREILVETRDGTEIEATVTAWDRKADVALLTLARGVEGGEPLSLASELPRVGDPAWTVGQPLVEGDGPSGRFEGLLAWSLSEGIVSSLGERRIQTTITLQGGNSGGPLLDADGRVLGVVVSTYGAFGLASTASPIADLQEAPARERRHVPLHVGSTLALRLDGFPEHDKPRRSYIGLRATLDLTIDRRMVVGVGANLGWLANSDEDTDPNPLRRSEVFAFVGPSFDLPHRPKGDMALVLQPYFFAGALIAESGSRTWETRYVDAGCDPASGPCPTDTTTDVTWDPSARMILGGGLRLLYGPAVIGFDVGTSPTLPGKDFRVGLTVGFHFGGP